MSDFDTRLRARLEHLDAAIPEPKPPSVVPLRRPGVRRRRQVVILLAATVALLSVSSILTSGEPPPPDPVQVARDAADEELIRNDLGPAFGGRCLAFGEARDLVRQRLDALGFSDWTIAVRNNYAQARCLGAAPVGDSHEVLLIPSMGGGVAAALEQVKDGLLQRCLGRDEATAFVRSALNDLGVTDFDVRADPWGPQMAPIDQVDAYRSHVAAGCFVWSGAQFDQNGRYTYHLWGPWP